MGIHIIAIIKNEKQEYLQYYDDKWKSYLFLNYKCDNDNIERVLRGSISEELNIDMEKMIVKKIGEKKHKKFSVSAGNIKEYTHYFYRVDLGERLRLESLENKDKEYKWYSHLDLLKDKRIQEVNSDIVQFVKEMDK